MITLIFNIHIMLLTFTIMTNTVNHSVSFTNKPSQVVPSFGVIRDDFSKFSIYHTVKVRLF